MRNAFAFHLKGTNVGHARKKFCFSLTEHDRKKTKLKTSHNSVFVKTKYISGC